MHLAAMVDTFGVVVLILDINVLFLDLFIGVLESIICKNYVCDDSRSEQHAARVNPHLPSMSSSDIVISAGETHKDPKTKLAVPRTT